MTDVGQSQHFEMVFDAARVCGLVPEACDVRHVPFGLVLVTYVVALIVSIHFDIFSLTG